MSTECPGAGQLLCVFLRVFVCFFFLCALIRHLRFDDVSARKRLWVGSDQRPRRYVPEWVFVCFSQRFPLGTALNPLVLFTGKRLPSQLSVKPETRLGRGSSM